MRISSKGTLSIANCTKIEIAIVATAIGSFIANVSAKYIPCFNSV